MKVGDKVTLFSAARGPFDIGVVTNISDGSCITVHIEPDIDCYFSSSTNRSVFWARHSKYANYIRPYTVDDDSYIRELLEVRGKLEALSNIAHNLTAEELLSAKEGIVNLLEVVNGRMGE